MTKVPPTPLPRAWQEDIRRAVEVMRKGGIILYPTDTIWGIGCDATNAEAVQRVFELKRRADAKALICLVDSDAKVQRYVRDVPSAAWDIIDCSVSPITIIYDKAEGLAPNLMAEDGSVGIRITGEPFSNALCYRMQKAIVSTSANISGQPAPAFYEDIPLEIIEAVDWVADPCLEEGATGEPSQIIAVGLRGEIKIIRE